MRVVSDNDVPTSAYDFAALLAFARANAGQWVELEAKDLPGLSRQDKQTRILQAARHRGFKVRTRSLKSSPDRVYLMFDGEIRRLHDNGSL
jgi:hypothetical protein